jgi:uncharacterized protein YndB with AHSA1/START domain
MNARFALDPTRDFAFERLIHAPIHLAWEALTNPEHVTQWYMPKAWGRVTQCEMQLRPGGIFSIDIAVGDGPASSNVGCFLEVTPMERLVWTSMLFPDYRPAVFDDIPITAVVAMEAVGNATRYLFTVLHRDGTDCEKSRASGFYEGTEIAVDQFVAHVMTMR